MHSDRRSSQGHKPKGATFTHVSTAPAQERFSEFFLPERGHLPVHRFELLAMLERYHQAEKANRWYRRLWRWLRARTGDRSTPAVPAPPALAERAEKIRAELEGQA